MRRQGEKNHGVLAGGRLSKGAPGNGNSRSAPLNITQHGIASDAGLIAFIHGRIL